MIEKYVGHRPHIASLVLRMVVGIVFFAHGVAKFQMGIDGTAAFFANVGIPMAGFMAWIVATVETVGGLALIIGVGTGFASILLSIVMLVAIFAVKWPNGLLGGKGGAGYELDITLLAGLLAILFSGPGRYSLTRIMRKMSNPVQM